MYLLWDISYSENRKCLAFPESSKSGNISALCLYASDEFTY